MQRAEVLELTNPMPYLQVPSIMSVQINEEMMNTHTIGICFFGDLGTNMNGSSS